MLYNMNMSALLLGCLMKNPSLLTQPNYPLDKEDFTPVEFHRVLFVCINNLYANGIGEISEIEIENFVKGHPIQHEVLEDNNYFEFVETVKELANVDNYEYYYQTVRKFSLLRELKQNGIDIKEFYDELGDEDKENGKLERLSIQEILSAVEKRSVGLRSKFDKTYVRDEKKAGEGTEELLLSFEENPAFGCMFQSPYLTTLFGGLVRGHLYMRSAAPSVGKTRMNVGELITIGANELWDYDIGDYIVNPNYQGPSFFIHTEMNQKTEVEPLFLAGVSGIEYRTIRNGSYTPEERLRVLKAGEILKASNITLVDMPEFTVASLEQKIKELVENEGVTYGVFDYVQILSSVSAEFKSMYALPPREDLVVKNITVALKAIAEKYSLGIICASQLNDNWRTQDFPDENSLSGAKSMKVKLDEASIVIPASERPKEMKKVYPLIEKKGYVKDCLMPNIIEYCYKSRFGTYSDKKIKVYSHFDKGTMRRTDFFCTDADDKLVKIPRTTLG